MKKLIALFVVTGLLTFSVVNALAQETESAAATAETAQVDETATTPTTPDQAPIGIHKQVKIKFVEGGVMWMIPILLCLIVGLAFCIERVIYLNLSSINTKKLIQNVEAALKAGGIESAKEVCRNTRGPVASIFYQGLDRYDEGVDVVEKSVVSYGSVQMGLLEKGLTWIALFIALAPMLGFLGTVVGMVIAFDTIAIMGDISPAAVAGGIKIALLTTVFGLIVAILLQVFYNYLVFKIDSLVTSMEDASISLLDVIVKYKLKN
jgi:biopolymer transport protein ExbB